jgi:hypothetical protein
MKSDWLAAANFERTHEVVSAINTLSIHAKLTLASVADPASDAEIEQARERLLDFLGRLEAVLHEVARDDDGTVVGTDPRLGELALHFIAGRTHSRQRPRPSAFPLETLPDLVRSDRPEDLRRLVPHLQELRALLEEETQADIAGILGDR